MGELATWQRDYGTAIRFYEEAISLAARVGENAARSVNNLADVALAQGDYERASELAAKAVILCREEDHREGVAVALSNLASANLHLNRAGDALISLKESLAISQQLDFTEGTAGALQTFATLLVEQRKASEAAQLIGAADVALGAAGTSLSPAERDIRDRTWQVLSTQLPEEARAEAEARGRNMTLDDAVAFAISTAEARATADRPRPNTSSSTH